MVKSSYQIDSFCIVQIIRELLQILNLSLIITVCFKVDKFLVCNYKLFRLLSLVLTQIEDLDTLREASEDDLRKAGLKMGDIIKIRKVLANPDSANLDSSLSSISETEEQKEPGKSEVNKSGLGHQVRYLPRKSFTFT